MLFTFDQMTDLGPNDNAAPTHEMPIVGRMKGDRRNQLVIAARKPAISGVFERRRCRQLLSVVCDGEMLQPRAGREYATTMPG